MPLVDSTFTATDVIARQRMVQVSGKAQTKSFSSVWSEQAQVNYTASGIPVGRFILATKEQFKDKSDKSQDRTEWHNIVVSQKLAEIVGEFISKGSHLYMEGKLQSTSWEDRQSAENKYRTEIVANDLVLLGSRRELESSRRAEIRQRKPSQPS